MFLPPCGPDEERIGILIAVPEPWMTELADLRVQAGDNHGTVTPSHITILPPTTVKKSEREAVMEHLQTVASRFAPFRISLLGTGSFRPVSPVVFVNVDKGHQTLIDLEDEIRSGILDRPTRFPYHPHVTIAQQVSDEKLDAAQEKLADYEAEWLVTGFRLDRVGNDGSYQSQALLTLNGPAA
ncbi:MAG: 2'-5' RNA ligase family protein [Actinomycetaceae bacterium]|nr:2'-5' RNA ligase family protein [Actinomycetaceae bacterium]